MSGLWKRLTRSGKRVKKSPITVAQKKEILMRALTDPKFRTRLEKTPETVFGVKKLSDEDVKIVNTTLSKLKMLEERVASSADQLLCNSGGPCGIY